MNTLVTNKFKAPVRYMEFRFDNRNVHTQSGFIFKVIPIYDSLKVDFHYSASRE